MNELSEFIVDFTEKANLHDHLDYDDYIENDEGEPDLSHLLKWWNLSHWWNNEILFLHSVDQSEDKVNNEYSEHQNIELIAAIWNVVFESIDSDL